MEDWYIFDDLYVYRQARALGVDGPLNDAQLGQLIHFLGWQIRARITWQAVLPPRVRIEDVDRMDEALYTTFRGRRVEWHELLEEWMTRLALHHGCSRWGYKVPQEFFHIHMIDRLFPGVRFVYLFRDPRRVMASLKYVRAEDGDPQQYHPAAYALYWRLAAESMERAKDEIGSRVFEVQFERLVRDPDAEARRIAAFLDTRLAQQTEEMRPNTSFSAGPRRGISPTELWICERLAGHAMQAKGYVLGEGRLRVRDLPEIFWLTLRFLNYQAMRMIRSKAARVSVAAYLHALLRRSARQHSARSA
jgi:hypothetical protein